MPRPETRADARYRQTGEAGYAISEALAHVFGVPAGPRHQVENLSAQAPSRQRSSLSARQRQALDAIRQRGRSTSEVAAILGTTDSEAHKTVLSLVRRHKVRLTTTQPRRWVAVWKPDDDQKGT